MKKFTTTRRSSDYRSRASRNRDSCPVNFLDSSQCLEPVNIGTRPACVAPNPKPQHTGMVPVLNHGTDVIHRSTEGGTGCSAQQQKEHNMLPVIGLLGTAFAALGTYLLVWYHDLTKEEREEADRLACEYAMQVYNLKLNQLSHSQKSIINDLVKRHF